MAARGHYPPSRSVQAPGMMRHGSYPGLGSSSGHRRLEPHHPQENLENKIADQAAEMERYTRENQRLATTHVALRQELVDTQQEIQRLEAHIGSIKTESDIQIRVLLEKIAKMDADIIAGETVKKELQQAHKEAKSLVLTRQELTTQIKSTSQELQKARAEVNTLPESLAELDSLRKEHMKLRDTFEKEKGLNIERVKEMYAMEKNLVSMAREIEKLRADVANAERRASAPNPNGGTGTYGIPHPHAPHTQAGMYTAYTQADPYAPQTQAGLYAPQGTGIFFDSYGRPYTQMSTVTSADGTNIDASGVASAAVVNSEGTELVGSYDVTSAPASSLAQR